MKTNLTNNATCYITIKNQHVSQNRDEVATAFVFCKNIFREFSKIKLVNVGSRSLL